MNMEKSSIRRILAVLCIVGGLTVGGSATGQQYEAHPPAGEAAQDFTESELESFAAAQEEVSQITQEFQRDTQGVQDPTKMMELRKEANQELTQAVRNSGLDPATYNAIASAVQQDPALAAKIENM